jgi:hypothetical protein
MSVFEINSGMGPAFELRVIPSDTTRKISIIKAIRYFTGKGLKEAKELVEDAETRSQTVVVTEDLSDSDLHEYLKVIERSGGVITMLSNSFTYQKYVDQLKEIAVAATLAGDYYVSASITEMLDKRFLNNAQDTNIS